MERYAASEQGDHGDTYTTGNIRRQLEFADDGRRRAQAAHRGRVADSSERGGFDSFREPSPGPAADETSDDEAEVEALVDARMVAGRLQYLVRWVGRGSDDDQWFHRDDLVEASEGVAAMVARFESDSSRRRAAQQAGKRTTPGRRLLRSRAASPASAASGYVTPVSASSGATQVIVAGSRVVSREAGSPGAGLSDLEGDKADSLRSPMLSAREPLADTDLIGGGGSDNTSARGGGGQAVTPDGVNSGVRESRQHDNFDSLAVEDTKAHEAATSVASSKDLEGTVPRSRLCTHVPPCVPTCLTQPSRVGLGPSRRRRIPQG